MQMYGLYKDPKGETIFAIPGIGKDNNAVTSSSTKSQTTQVVLPIVDQNEVASCSPHAKS